MSNPWQALQQFMDAQVDLHLAEPVEFHPWIVSEYTTDGSGPDTDTNRPVVFFNAMYVSTGSNVTGEASATVTRIVDNAVWLSVTIDVFDYRQVKKGDRFYFPDRGEWYEVSYPPAPSATRRPNIPLIRIPDADL
jgi:hypothetical protein